MIQWTDEMNKQYAMIKIIAIALLVVAPVVYILIANVVPAPETAEPNFADLMFYILLIMSAVQPMILPFLEKSNLKVYMNQISKPAPIQFFKTISIIKAAFVESIFIYGLVVYFISGDINRMYYFYPIGIIWVTIIFPTKSRCEAFLEKVERYGQTNPIG